MATSGLPAGFGVVVVGGAVVVVTGGVVVTGVVVVGIVVAVVVVVVDVGVVPGPIKLSRTYIHQKEAMPDCMGNVVAPDDIPTA